ncbi:MAG: di-trans,poly-cis-decaprenylcistransferase [Chloroflexi bacterium RBG_13_46_9]|nr:MAG: di-trans,poly-cis-decaprenylcistransferase [Chloroflexi bacterium RBG_13_46_9]
MKSAAQKFKTLPTHVAIVPDGNGRWAQQRGLPRIAGHRAGILNMFKMINYINEYPIPYVTFYGFSTENWNRPKLEVTGLFGLVEHFVGEHLKEIHEKNIKIRHVGGLEGLPEMLASAIKKSVVGTEHNTGMVLSICWNYGGRAEILNATRRIIADRIQPEALNEDVFSSYLYTAGIPDVDLLVRTGDETRLSNFLLWQTAYSEYYFTKVLWPDFDKKNIDMALTAFSKRHRRFGGL